MKSKMEYSKHIAMHFFKEHGYSVEEIAEAEDKRADLNVSDGIDNYIIEVKEKIDTGNQIKWSAIYDRKTSFLVGEESHSCSENLRGKIRKANKQIIETPSKENALHLLWFFTQGNNADMITRRLLYTFYGIANLIPVNQKGDGVNCVYFEYSASYRMQELDGIILVENDRVNLCLNEYSKQYHKLQKSKLHKIFNRDAIYDPETFEARPGTIVFRSDMSRKDENQVLEELENVTGVRYRKIVVNRYTFAEENS